MTWTVRPAVAADARGIADVHVATWRAAYAGIVPQAHLDGPMEERRVALWTRLLAGGSAPAGQCIWVAVAAVEDDDVRRVVGFSNAGASRDPDGAGRGELFSIYVRPSHWDTGAGRVLHDRALGSLRAARFPAATLWVLADNARARRFYERCGWRPDGATQSLDILGVALAEVRYRIDLGRGA